MIPVDRLLKIIGLGGEYPVDFPDINKDDMISVDIYISEDNNEYTLTLGDMERPFSIKCGCDVRKIILGFADIWQFTDTVFIYGDCTGAKTLIRVMNDLGIGVVYRA